MSSLIPYEFIEQLKALPFIESIYIYGSRARGDHRERSDIDLALSCPHADALEWQRVLDIVDQADTLLPIDVIRLDELPDGPLKHNIERDKKILYRKEERDESL